MCTHLIRYTSLVPGWTPFSLQSHLNSSWHRFNKLLETFLRHFGPYCHVSIAQLLQICQLRIHDGNLNHWYMWCNHLNVGTERHSSDQATFSGLVLCISGKAVWIVACFLFLVAPGLVFCSCSPFASRFNLCINSNKCFELLLLS